MVGGLSFCFHVIQTCVVNDVAYFLTSSNDAESRYLKAVHTVEQALAVGRGPRVVLASLPSLAAGLSRQLLLQWAPAPSNLLLFTSAPPVRLSLMSYSSANNNFISPYAPMEKLNRRGKMSLKLSSFQRLLIC